LTGAAARRLYGAFLEDAARVYGTAGVWESVLQAEPDPQHPELVRLFAPPWRREAQAAGDLGARLASAFRGAFSRGAPAAVAVGSDHPALSRARVEEAFARLASGQTASLIPAEDGGYCAIGLSAQAPVEEVFRDIPWSSPAALVTTCERMRDAGLSVAVLEPGYDIDRPEDLARLRRDLTLRDQTAPDYPVSTARVLAEIFP
jgi:rSAM/selenodomain-associated transferase 1